jgi:hypothetical protein
LDVDADISRRSDWEFEPGTIYESKDIEKIIDIDEGEIRYLINKYKHDIQFHDNVLKKFEELSMLL